MTTFLDHLISTVTHQNLLDMANYGADGGFPGLTYTADLVLLCDEHQEEIFDAIVMDAEDLGYSSLIEFISTFHRADGIIDSDTFKERLVWYMAKREAQRYADACEHGGRRNGT